MANELYVNYKNFILVDAADYTVNLATHQDRADVAGGARTATEAAVGLVVANGAVDLDDLTFPTVSGDQSEGIVVVKNTGVEANDTLFMYLDTFNAGMPVTPNGGDIDLIFDPAGLCGL
jgi:hypothetical protein